MPQQTTAGRLLTELYREAPAVRDAVATAAAITIARADAAMKNALRLSLSEQLRLAEAAQVIAPKFSRDAFRLRGQVLAAQSFESGELVETHRDAPIERWERLAQLRR